MKKIVISRHQLLKLNEESNNPINIAAQASDNTLSSFTKAATSPNTISDIQKAKSAGDVNVVVASPETRDDQPTIVANVEKGDTVQNVMSKINPRPIQNGSAVQLKGGGIGLGESYVFTKKALREARLAKIKREGKVYTKKELTERFLNNL
jgi:hypothetical protein